MANHIDISQLDAGVLEDFDNEKDLRSYLMCKYGSSEVVEKVIALLEIAEQNIYNNE